MQNIVLVKKLLVKEHFLTTMGFIYLLFYVWNSLINNFTMINLIKINSRIEFDKEKISESEYTIHCKMVTNYCLPRVTGESSESITSI